MTPAAVDFRVDAALEPCIIDSIVPPCLVPAAGLATMRARAAERRAGGRV